MLRADAYKDTTTSRGYKYHYYFSPARDSKTTLLFCHGFPSTSQDWHRIVPHFEQQGYGIIAPDMLGYGGTDKPTDPAAYKGTLLAKDVVEVFTAENIDKVIAVGHDWGASIVSRLANVAPERILAYAFLAVAYVTPNPDFNMNNALKLTKSLVGYELFGYWMYFAQDEAAQEIENNWDTFFGLIWPHDPAIWRTHVAPLGSAKTSILSGEKFPLPSYLSEDDKKDMSDALRKGGLAAPTCYYKVQVRGDRVEDDRTIPEDRRLPPASSPIFFGAALKDYICLAPMQKKVFADPQFQDHQITIRDFDADHWLILSHADEINRELDGWLQGIVSKIHNANL